MDIDRELDLIVGDGFSKAYERLLWAAALLNQRKDKEKWENARDIVDLTMRFYQRWMVPPSIGR